VITKNLLMYTRISQHKVYYKERQKDRFAEAESYLFTGKHQEKDHKT